MSLPKSSDTFEVGITLEPTFIEAAVSTVQPRKVWVTANVFAEKVPFTYPLPEVIVWLVEFGVATAPTVTMIVPES